MCLYHGVFPSSHRDNISKRVRVCSPGLAQKWGWSEDSAGACCCCHQHCCLHFLSPFSFLCWSCVFLKRKCVQGKPSVYVNVEEPRIRDGWLGMQEWEIVVGILRFEPTNQMAFKDSMYLKPISFYPHFILGENLSLFWIHWSKKSQLLWYVDCGASGLDFRGFAQWNVLSLIKHSP